MTKVKMSGPALVMNGIIYVSAFLTVLCFALYYGGFFNSAAVLWTGVVSFTILYQLELRLVFGKINGRLHINYKQRWFRSLAFERRFYELLRVRKWRGKVLTYNPELFTLHNHTMEEIANTMAKVELDHWANVIISLTTVILGFIWGALPVFIAAAVFAILFDYQFIVVQRYNRPGVVKVIELQNKKRQKVTV